MNRKSQIETLLEEVFHPLHLKVTDESHLHAGHAGSRPGGETHFRVFIVSELFQNKSRVERHRMVYEALKPAISAGIHALSIEAKAPVEA